MAVTLNTRAIVLYRQNCRETDRRVVFWSRDFGKIEALSIGASKITSKLAGHLEPFCEVDLMLVRGKNVEKVGQAVTRVNYLKQAGSLESYWYGGRALKLVADLTRPGQKDPVLSGLLKTFLNLIKNDPPALSWPPLWCAFCLKLLSVLGYEPEFYHCGHCRKNLQPTTNYFSPKDSQLICGICQGKNARQELPTVTKEILTLCRYSLNQPLPQILKLKINVATARAWQGFIRALLLTHQS